MRTLIMHSLIHKCSTNLNALAVQIGRTLTRVGRHNLYAGLFLLNPMLNRALMNQMTVHVHVTEGVAILSLAELASEHDHDLSYIDNSS